MFLVAVRVYCWASMKKSEVTFSCKGGKSIVQLGAKRVVQLGALHFRRKTFLQGVSPL